MSKILALQIDPIDGLNFKNDSSIFIAKYFQKSGYSILHYTPDSLSLDRNTLYAQGYEVELFDTKPFYKNIKKTKIKLKEVDLILIRQDPPFDMNYITSTYLLDFIKGSTKILNCPTAIRSNVEKLMIYDFPKFILPSIISQHLSELHKFFLKYKKVILKPLYGHGGKNIKLIQNEKDFFTHIQPLLDSKEHFLLQKFCDSITSKGDKRVIIINGKICATLSKKATEGRVTTNMATGGIVEASTLTKKQKDICTYVGRYLKKKNIFLAGIDIVDNYLLEINITSPTMLKTYHDLTGIDLSKKFYEEFTRQS